MDVPGVDLSNGDAEMASPSKTIGAPATDGGPSVAPSEIDAEGEPDLDDLFGDGELDGLAAGLDIPANLLDAVPVDPSEASATVPAATSAAPPAVAPLALPNGTTRANGVVPKLEPNGTEPLPAASVSAEAASSSASVARSVPSLSPATYGAYSPDVLMTSAIDGSVVLWDRRVSDKEAGNGRGVGRLEGPERTPKWCMSVRADDCARRLLRPMSLILHFLTLGLLQLDRHSGLGWPAERCRRHLGRSPAIERLVGSGLQFRIQSAQEPQEPIRLRRGQLSRRLPGRQAHGLVRSL
jgi:hypothetical protein